MKKYLSVLFIVFTFTSLSFGQSRELVWSDEFDYEGLPDPDKWGYDVGGHGWGNNEEQYYTEYRLDNARVTGGNLIIEARKELYDNRIYTSARLVSRDKGDWKYGYFEMRAILPAGRGTWPAFWMLPTDWEYGGWPDSGEIDIMEHVGYDPSTVHGSVHTKDYNHMLGTQVTKYRIVSDCETEFHTYACEWTPTQIKMYVDDVHYFTFNKLGSWTKWPFDKRFHILLNIAVGGTWGGQLGIDDNAFPTQFVIDYVRVYGPGSGPAAVLEDTYKDKINVYPNPTEGNVTVDLSQVNLSEDIRITIFNTMGQENSKQIASPGFSKVTVDLSSFQSSAYYYVIQSSEGVLKRGAIFKN